MDLACALQSSQSDNIFAAVRNGCPAAALEIGAQDGPEGLIEMFNTFGLTEDPALPLPGNQGTGSAASLELQTFEEELTGQGNLLVSPLQITRAMASIQTGTLPTLKLIDSIHLPDGSWEQVRIETEPASILTAQTVSEILNGTNPGTGHPLCFAGQALTGTDYQSTAWVTCLTERENPVVLTIVLEESLPAQAAVLANQLLDLPAFSSP
jgi:cell division protein FtsI/penicillin-binding protein 2